jgi:hypothetical protein
MEERIRASVRAVAISPSRSTRSMVPTGKKGSTILMLRCAGSHFSLIDRRRLNDTVGIWDLCGAYCGNEQSTLICSNMDDAMSKHARKTIWQPWICRKSNTAYFSWWKAMHLQFLNIMHEYVWKSVRKLVPCYLAQGDASSHLHQLLPQFSRL